MAPGEVTTRTVTRELFVPWEDTDSEKTGYVDEYISNEREAAKFDIQIQALKEKQKPFKQSAEEALDKLTKGKLQFVECEERIFWDENLVTTKRKDNGEDLPDREIIAADRELRVDDETV